MRLLPIMTILGSIFYFYSIYLFIYFFYVSCMYIHAAPSVIYKKNYLDITWRHDVNSPFTLNLENSWNSGSLY